MSDLDFKQFARYGVATVYEAAGQKGLVDESLLQIVPGSKVAGPALTVRCGANDNLMVHAAIAYAQPGEVLVLTLPEPAPISLVGELLAIQAHAHKVAAILVDAAVRDVDELRALGLPIWARWIRARGTTKNTIGTLNETVVVGGITISPRDIVVLDADGAVVVPQDQAAKVLQDAQQRETKEAALKSKLQDGALTYDLHGYRAKVEGRNQ